MSGGSSGIGRRVAVAADVVAAGGSAVIVGHRQDKVAQTVAELSATGTARGIAADLRDLAGLVKVQAQAAGCCLCWAGSASGRKDFPC